MAWSVTRRSAQALKLPSQVEGSSAHVQCSVPPELALLYRAHFAFVWRSVRRLGVPAAAVDDAVHDVFLVVHKRLADFVPGSAERPWLFGIARRVVQHARRKHWREQLRVCADAPYDAQDRGLDPEGAAVQAETARQLQRCLDALDEDKRCVLILADIEQMSGPEVAQALETNLNTVYARLRVARQQFAAALLRERAREARR